MGSRTWIKIHCEPWITGSLRGETAELRGIWADLLALAGNGQFGDTGEIKLINGMGYTDEQIAGILRIPLDIWKTAKQHLVSTQRINITPEGAIYIVNWSKYQSEYIRQKKAGDSKRVSDNFLKENKKKNEKEIEIENIKRNNKENLYNPTSNIEGSNQLNPSDDISIKAKDSVTYSADSNHKSTIRELVNRYLKEHGASRSSDISKAVGITSQELAVFFHQNKKRYLLIERGVWSLPIYGG